MDDWITKLVAGGESESLELKSTTGGRREAVRCVCAMLNQDGGKVLFGVTPEGEVAGQQVSEQTIEKLSAEFQRIKPQAFPKIERIPVSDDRELIVISIDQGPARPYQYNGTAYRRVGNTTLAMTTEEYKRMLLESMHPEQRWENQVADGWSIEDLYAAEIQQTVEEAIRLGRLKEPGTREPDKLLQGFKLLEEGVLLRAAVVLFGKDDLVEARVPQCMLRVARFKGTDRSEFWDNRQFYGNAFTLLRAAERFLRETLPIAGRFEPDRFERIDEPLYPPLAVREALTNALCHRDYFWGSGSIGVAVYDDRLEVTSPGPLHFGLMPEDLFVPHDSRPWNPLISRVFYRRGTIEEWGRGTLKMVELAADGGLPPPEIEGNESWVTVRFWPARPISTRASGTALTERQQMILALLDREGNPLTLHEIHRQLEGKIPKRQLKEDLSVLKIKRLLAVTGYARGARWKRIGRPITPN